MIDVKPCQCELCLALIALAIDAERTVRERRAQTKLTLVHNKADLTSRRALDCGRAEATVRIGTGFHHRTRPTMDELSTRRSSRVGRLGGGRRAQ